VHRRFDARQEFRTAVSCPQVLKSGVVGGADAVFHARAVAALGGGDVGVSLVGEDGLEAVAIVIGEAQLGAG
jgi:hypothetical protein